MRKSLTENEYRVQYFLLVKHESTYIYTYALILYEIIQIILYEIIQIILIFVTV